MSNIFKTVSRKTHPAEIGINFLVTKNLDAFFGIGRKKAGLSKREFFLQAALEKAQRDTGLTYDPNTNYQETEEECTTTR